MRREDRSNNRVYNHVASVTQEDGEMECRGKRNRVEDVRKVRSEGRPNRSSHIRHLTRKG